MCELENQKIVTFFHIIKLDHDSHPLSTALRQYSRLLLPDTSSFADLPGGEEIHRRWHRNWWGIRLPTMCEKTMSETTHDCEWLVYTTYKDGDLGMVFWLFHPHYIGRGWWKSPTFLCKMFPVVKQQNWRPNTPHLWGPLALVFFFEFAKEQTKKRGQIWHPPEAWSSPEVSCDALLSSPSQSSCWQRWFGGDGPHQEARDTTEGAQ